MQAVAAALAAVLIAGTATGAYGLVKSGPSVAGGGLNARLKATGGTGLSGDTVAFSVWWGLRAYSTAQKNGTTPAVRLRRASDSLEADINIATSGDLDIATATSHCAATTCFVRWIYDQVGGTGCGGAPCHAGAATAGNQPEFVFNCQDTKPCLRAGNLATIFLQSAAFGPAPTGIVSFYWVAGSTGSSLMTWQNSTGGNRVGQTPTVFNMNGGTSGAITGAVGGGGLRPGVGVMNGAASLVNDDGTVVTGTVVGSLVAGAVGGFRAPATGVGTYTEMGTIDNVALTSPQQDALIAGAKAYYGLP